MRIPVGVHLSFTDTSCNESRLFLVHLGAQVASSQSEPMSLPNTNNSNVNISRHMRGTRKAKSKLCNKGIIQTRKPETRYAIQSVFVYKIITGNEIGSF